MGPGYVGILLEFFVKGGALEVFVRLSIDDQSDYNQLKEALLTNFDLMERSFRTSLGNVGLRKLNHSSSLVVDWRVS